jgi:Uma2 family endonuclease
MSTEVRPATIEDVAALPDDGHRYDLIRGKLIRMSPARGRHGEISSKIDWLIGNVVWPERLGRVYTAEAGFILARGPDVLLCPDVAFVSAERLPPDTEREQFMDLPPDLAVEVLSPSETARASREKVDAYLAAGAKVVWVVDPVRRSVAVHLASGVSEILSEDDHLDGGDLLPGFNVPVTEIFE